MGFGVVWSFSGWCHVILGCFLSMFVSVLYYWFSTCFSGWCFHTGCFLVFFECFLVVFSSCFFLSWVAPSHFLVVCHNPLEKTYIPLYEDIFGTSLNQKSWVSFENDSCKIPECRNLQKCCIQVRATLFLSFSLLHGLCFLCSKPRQNKKTKTKVT